MPQILLRVAMRQRTKFQTALVENNYFFLIFPQEKAKPSTFFLAALFVHEAGNIGRQILPFFASMKVGEVSVTNINLLVV